MQQVINRLREQVELSYSSCSYFDYLIVIVVLRLSYSLGLCLGYLIVLVRT